MKFFSKRTGGIVLAILFSTIAGFAISANAADTATTTFKFQAQWPASPMGTDIAKDTNPTLAEGIKYVYEWGVGLGGLAVFIALILAGFEYVTSIGNPSKMQDAFNRIRDAVIGLVILLSSYAILSLIGINPGNLKINMFQGEAKSPIKSCSSAKGEPAPACCNKNDTGCKPEYYTCVGYDGDTKGLCVPNMNKTECGSVKINFENGDKLEYRKVDKQEPVAARIKIDESQDSIEFYDTEGNPCYDSLSKNEIFKDSKNKICNCGLQVFTKKETTSGGWFTNPCEGAEIYIANNSESLKNYIQAKNVVCIALKKTSNSF